MPHPTVMAHANPQIMAVVIKGVDQHQCERGKVNAKHRWRSPDFWRAYRPQLDLGIGGHDLFVKLDKTVGFVGYIFSFYGQVVRILNHFVNAYKLKNKFNSSGKSKRRSSRNESNSTVGTKGP